MKWPIFGDLSPNEAYNFSTRPSDNRPVRVLIIMGLFFMVGFLWVYFQPQNQGYSWLFGLLTASVVYKLLRLLHEWYHYWNVTLPAPPVRSRQFRVDVFTTYCPGEPHEMVVNTLRAIQNLRYPHTTYLCDEADDPYLKQVCAELGVRHVTRQDKTDAKAGNINNALRQATGEICLIIDPDHVPVPDFLDHVLAYFENPEIGFVQCVQGYYNRKESIVAFGASEQTYSFYGPMMTCMSNYGTTQAIGANCTFRRSALDSIGGHANGLSEDMHTAMLLHANGWKSVYVPLPLSYGLVPATLSAYYKQQLKWARGTFELLFTTYPRVFGRLTNRQRLHYGTLPLYYLLGTVQLIDLIIPIASLIMMRLPLHLDLVLFATAYIPLLLTGFLIRQYAQRWLIEKHEAGFHLIGGILASGTWWVYVLGLIYTIFRVKVPYIPTPKDDRPRNNFLLILPNLIVILITLGAIVYSIYWYGRFALSNIFEQLMIGFGLLNVIILGLNVVIGQEKMLMEISRLVRQFSLSRPRVFQSLRLAGLRFRYNLYYGLRLAAIPLSGGVLVVAIGLGYIIFYKGTNTPTIDIHNANTQPFYVGSETSAVLKNSMGASTETAPIIPYHVSWPVASPSELTYPKLGHTVNQLPLFYLEPQGWATDTSKGIHAFLASILAGKHNSELMKLVEEAKQFHHPILVSFMPEFDNPGKPWGTDSESNLMLFREVWRYVVRYCQQQGATNLVWVWCPAQPSSLVAYYPGSDYVNWLGFSVVNDPDTAPDGRSHSFAALYQLPHTTVRTHAAYSIRQKPILITRLATKAGESPDSTDHWFSDAIEMLQERYPQVRGVVFPDEKSLIAHRHELITP